MNIINTQKLNKSKDKSPALITINSSGEMSASTNVQYINQKPSQNFFDIRNKLEELFENFMPQKELNTKEELNNKFLNLDFGAEFEINADKIGVNDAIFFINLLNQQNLINFNVQDNKIQLTTFDNKKINATNSLLNMLQTSIDSKKPIRLDFENDVTVILKLDNDGKIQAHFIPGNAEVEKYLKNNIQSLKQTFDEEEINYSYLGYSKKQRKFAQKKR